MAPAAIDGDRTAGLVAVGPPNAWLSIDLGEPTSVSYVVVSTTKPFGQASVPLAPFELWLGASSDADLTTAPMTLCTTTDDELAKAVQPPRITGVTEVTLACMARGSHLTLRLVGANLKGRWLMLTEVAVFAGSITDAPLLSTTTPVSVPTHELWSLPPPSAPVAPHRPPPVPKAAVHGAAADSAVKSVSDSTSQVAATRPLQGVADSPMTASEPVGGATAITHTEAAAVYTQKVAVLLCIVFFLCGAAVAVACGYCFIVCGHRSPLVAPERSPGKNGAADDDGMLSADEAPGSTGKNKGGRRGTGKMKSTSRRYAPLQAGMVEDSLAELEEDVKALGGDARGRKEAARGRPPGMRGGRMDDSDDL